MKPHRCRTLRNMLRTRMALSQQIDCATARTRSALFHPTWSVMLSTPISQTQPGRSSFMREKLGGILRCATVSTFQTTPIAGWKEKCGLDLSLLLSVSSVCSDDGRGPPTGVAARLLLPGEMASACGQMFYYSSVLLNLSFRIYISNSLFFK